VVRRPVSNHRSGILETGHKNLAIDQSDLESAQSLAYARPLQTQSVFDPKQGTMSNTLDMSLTPIEEAVGLPFQIDTGMRTSISIGKHLVSFAHYKKVQILTLTRDPEPQTARVFQRIDVTNLPE
jgi:hypothetical protein